MANITPETQNPSNPGRSSALRNGIIIFPIIALIGVIWLILLKLEMLPESLTFGQDFTTWLNLWMVIFVILIVILICIPQTGGSAEAKEVEIPSVDVKPKTKKIVKATKPTMVTVEADEKPVEFIPVAKTDKKEVPTLSASVTKTEVEPVIATVVTADEKPDIKPADVVAFPAAKEKIKPKIVEYPLEVDDGIYGDTFINLDDDTVLKLRTLVVKDIYLL